MSTDFRALCAELLDELVFRPVLLDRDLIERARTALAEPVAERVTLPLPEHAPDEHPPSSLDRREVAAWYHGHGCGWQAARAALAEPVDAPATVAERPSDEELLALMPQQFRNDLATVSRLAANGAGPVMPRMFRAALNTGAIAFARAVFNAGQRWSSTISPLPAGALPRPGLDHDTTETP